MRFVDNFRMFLFDHEILLRTDHLALRNLLSRDLPRKTRLERWILHLSEYTFKVEYQRTHVNVIVNVMSQFPFAAALDSNTLSFLDRSFPVACAPRGMSSFTNRRMDTSSYQQMRIPQQNKARMASDPNFSSQYQNTKTCKVPSKRLHITTLSRAN